MQDTRILVWFSCGAASAVAAKLAIAKYQERAIIVHCDTLASEHPDNARFFADVQRWLGREIITIKSSKYATIDDVFEERRYLANIWGAHCTIEMKKVPLPERTQAPAGVTSKMWLLPPSADRANLRSETPRGFATAVFNAFHKELAGAA